MVAAISADVSTEMRLRLRMKDVGSALTPANAFRSSGVDIDQDGSSADGPLFRNCRGRIVVVEMPMTLQVVAMLCSACDGRSNFRAAGRTPRAPMTHLLHFAFERRSRDAPVDVDHHDVGNAGGRCVELCAA